MPDRQRYRDGITGPLVPLKNVNVGATDGGTFYSNQNIVVPRTGLLEFLQPDAALRFRFDQCSHARPLVNDAKFATNLRECSYGPVDMFLAKAR